MANKKVVPNAFGMSYEEFLKLYEETNGFEDEQYFDAALKEFCEKKEVKLKVKNKRIKK